MKSYLHIYQVPLIVCIVKEASALFGDRLPKDGGLLIHLEDADNVPLAYHRQSHSTFKFHHKRPIIEDNFYYDISKVNMKRPVNVGLKEQVEEVDILGQWLRQVSSPSIGSYAAEDVKPVTEIIEDDLKYDFRTKTHSVR